MMTLSIQTGKVTEFTASTSTGWYTVTFETAFAEGTVPQVFAQIQTRNGQDTPGLRLKNISNTSFDVRMDELITSNVTSSIVGDLGTVKGSGDHPNAETLGWLAIELA